MNQIAALVGRLLLALLFVVSGANKLFALAATDTLIASAGLPPGLALPVALFEVIGGLAIAIGVMTRLFAVLFAGFSIVTMLLFHRDFADPLQAAMALKNLAIAGGFLCLFAHSQMRWSYEAMRIARRGEVAARSAEERAREADLRAARAEAKAEALARIAPARPVMVDSEGTAAVPPRRRRWW